MKKIAVLTSTAGDCAERLVSLFHEGNRFKVELILTDCENDLLKERFAETGVEVVVIPREKWQESPEEIAGLLELREIELVALDGFGETLPGLVAETYAGRIVTLTDPEEAPREVVAAFNQLKEEIPQAGEKEETSEKAEIPEKEKSVDEEWAETLHLNYDESRLASTPPPVPGQPQTPPQQPAPVFGQPQQPSFIRQQPQQQPAEPMPPTYLVWAIVMTIFCCTIPGIVAIIFSSQVSGKYAIGDYEGSKRASRNTEIWIIVSFVLGVLNATLYLPLTML